MSTRAQVRFATREEGVSFSEHPDKINAQFYVHHDGYPEGLGIEIAESLINGSKIEGWEVENLNTRHTDLEYIYYVWQVHGKDTWISIFERHDYSFESWNLDFKEEDAFECIFVGEPQTLIDKYKPNTNDEG